MDDNGMAPIRWAPKVRMDTIRQLYRGEAQGLLDPILVDEVGLALHARCVSILQVTDAARGRAVCHACGQVISFRPGHDTELLCECGWRCTWERYHRSYANKQLFGGAATQAFADYVEQYPRMRTPQERMLCIDYLIHQFHWNLVHGTPEATRPAAANLLAAGRLADVVAFLDELSGLKNG